VHKEEDKGEKSKSLHKRPISASLTVFSFLSYPLNLLLCDLCVFAVKKS
jgi:hypothetical protein